MIVIAGQQYHGHRQALQQVAQEAVFLFVAKIDQIAGDHDDVRQLWRGQQRVDGGAQGVCGVDHAVRELAASLDMQIGQLCHQIR